MANKKHELTHWRKLDGKLPVKTLMLCFNVDTEKNQSWISSPFAVTEQEMVDQYAADNKTVAFLVIPDAREVLS